MLGLVLIVILWMLISYRISIYGSCNISEKEIVTTILDSNESLITLLNQTNMMGDSKIVKYGKKIIENRGNENNILSCWLSGDESGIEDYLNKFDTFDQCNNLLLWDLR
jgi:hypothetical protein